MSSRTQVIPQVHINERGSDIHGGNSRQSSLCLQNNQAVRYSDLGVYRRTLAGQHAAVITWFAEGFQGFLVQQWIFTTLYFLWPFVVLTAITGGDWPGHPFGGSRSAGRSLHDFGLWAYYGPIVFVTFGVLALLGERYGWTSFGLELGSALLSSLVLPFFLYLVYRNLILGIALGPAIVVTLVAGIAAALHLEGDWWESLIVLFPALLLVAAPWSGLGMLLLRCAEKSHGRPRLGPFTKFISMTFLFVPLMWSVWVLGESLPDSETWQPVCVTIMGVLMSIVVSDPLKRLLKACWDPSSSAQGA